MGLTPKWLAHIMLPRFHITGNTIMNKKATNPRTKLRVIVNGVHFYSTVKQVKEGVGDHTDINEAVQACLQDIVDFADGCIGSVMQHNDINVQVSIL